MSEISPRLALPLIQPAQAQKHVTHNEALMALDLAVQLALEGFDAATPPLAPIEGEAWALGATPLAAWAGQPDRIAVWRDGTWVFVTPGDGWRAWGRAEAELRVFSAGAWIPAVDVTPDLQNLAGVGIGTSSDTTNRLAVAAEAVLFSHAGTDHRVKLNKAAPGDTASLLFQTGFSGRAEMGLAGSDGFAVKVSADGSGFQTALSTDAASGRVTLPAGLALGGLAGDPSGVADGWIWLDSGSGELRGYSAGASRPLGLPVLPWIAPASGEYLMSTALAGGATTTTLTGAVNRTDLFPFLPAGTVTLDAVALNVTTAVASALAKVVIYGSDAAGRADQLILETASLDLSSTGAKTATAALTLMRGRTYWLGVRHSSTATLSAWAGTATPDIPSGSLSTGLRKTLRRSLTFATAAPSSWGYLSAEIASAVATAIWLRAA